MRPVAGFWPALISSTLFTLLAGYLSVSLGPTSADPQFTLYQIRLPRFVTAVLVGAALGVAGSLLQLATRNPLSEPELLGVNQSAVFAVVLLLLVSGGGAHPLLMLAVALLGGGVTGVAILLMSASGAFPRERLILAGLTMAFFFASACSGLLLLAGTDLFELLHWTAGKLSGANWLDAGLVGACLIPVALVSVARATQWNALLLGDDTARGLGIDPVNRRVEIVSLAVLLCAVSVSVAGPIGFVGIIVPHLANMLAGLDYRRRIPLILLMGGALVALSDVLARIVLHPAEIPVGILTALVGAPYFLYRAQKL
ncbi:MAG: iron ABC transporter permease [Candidatus Eremiobacteraeota bacterium]|nr:iron ABC transporter permease [Candidatus Eremiobacteraeota bacterium]